MKISDIGNCDIPQNPNQRGSHKPEGEKLDAYNNRQEKEYLHPTKGKRKLNPKRTAAAILVAEMRSGATPFSMSIMQREMKLAGNL